MENTNVLTKKDIKDLHHFQLGIFLLSGYINCYCGKTSISNTLYRCVNHSIFICEDCSIKYNLEVNKNGKKISLFKK